MTTARWPRVAAIGLDDTQLASIAPLCGDLRPRDSVDSYLRNYSWTETDVVVSSAFHVDGFDSSVNLMSIGPGRFLWLDSYLTGKNSRRYYARTDTPNTERELEVPTTCSAPYKSLADALCSQLRRAEEPPDVMATSRNDRTALIETTSGRPVALRLVLPSRSTNVDGESSIPIALLLPEVSNLAAWFRAFLYDIHESDPERVPHAPPRLVQPSDWYTPREMALADRISHIGSQIELLSSEREQLQNELADEAERSDGGIRRILWADGEDLVAAVGGRIFRPRVRSPRHGRRTEPR